MAQHRPGASASADPRTDPAPGAAAPESAVPENAPPENEAPGGQDEVARPLSPRPSAPAASRRKGFGWFTRGAAVDPILEPLLAAAKAARPKEDLAVVQRAYRVAEQWHRGQQRRSGDPYITHPVAVATILAELGSPPAVLAAALLHDTVEDTEYSLEQLTREFGEEIALLVDGVTKLDKVTYGDAAQAETVRKMIIAMSKDVRVLLIKLADRLHNARTWKHVKRESAERKARETLEIYAPLAHRLGLNTIKWELEDRSFQALYPKVYDEIVDLVASHAPARDNYLREVVDRINADLRQAKIRATVTGRPKHYYSIYQKMIVRGRDFQDIYDLVGVRILVDSVRDCYGVLGTMHARWSPVPGRFKDYIALPKFNLYQSLHTTVIGPSGKPVEIQIRTWDMHRRAEYGVAAHWKYKARSGQKEPDGPGQSVAPGGAHEMQWLRALVDWQHETADSGEFLDSLRYEMASQEVYVFTPKGDVLSLPQGATPVDFAYQVHTEVGHRTMGSRVNGRLVPLDTELSTGDTVEIFTSKAEGAGPSHDWLSFVASPRARSKIKHWFTRERRDEAIERGKDQLDKEMRRQNLPLRRLMTHDRLTQIAEGLHHADVSALYAAIGENAAQAGTVVNRLVDLHGGVDGAEEDLAEAVIPSKARSPQTSKYAISNPGIIVKGVDDIWVKLAKCCTPVPGDPIVGFVTRGSGVSVHHSRCANVEQLQREPERMVEVTWDDHINGQFMVHIRVEALDRNRLLADLAQVVSEYHVNIQAASSSSDDDRLATANFTFETTDPGYLGHILRAVRKVEGVYDVYRVTADGKPVHGTVA